MNLKRKISASKGIFQIEKKILNFKKRNSQLEKEIFKLKRKFSI